MRTVLRRLKKEYPDTHGSLNSATPHELLIATILSAQCTDARVNSVTSLLFRKYTSPASFATAPVSELAAAIRPCGYYNQKSRAIRACSRKIVQQFGGKVPSTMEELLTLPGVGRKTANCLLAGAFGVPAIAVDTHMIRILNLLGFVETRNPEVIEREMMMLAPKPTWGSLTHLVIAHGRRICIARRPKCDECILSDLCPSSRA